MGRTTFSGPVKSDGGFISGQNTNIVVTNIYAASATLDFPSIAANGVQDLTISVPNAVVGDYVAMSLPAAPTAGIMFMAFVSAPGVVTVRARNVTAAAVDPAAATYGVMVFDTAPI